MLADEEVAVVEGGGCEGDDGLVESVVWGARERAEFRLGPLGGSPRCFWAWARGL